MPVTAVVRALRRRLYEVGEGLVTLALRIPAVEQVEYTLSPIGAIN